MTETLLRHYPSVVPQTVCGGDEAFQNLARISTDPLGEGKKRLFIGRQQGKFLKKCPGTRHMVCCNYYVLNIGSQCVLDCSYCILQEYFQNNPVLKVFCNIRDSFPEMEALVKTRPQGIFRIGTGEFTDSLALDEVAGFSHELIPFFSGKKNLMLELKTKTTKIANLLRYEDVGNIVVAWSLNPDGVVEGEEEGAPPLAERLEAARACAERGYKIAFHFDPLILCQGWEEEYRDVVEGIFQKIPSSRIVWISMGGFRFRPALKSIIRQRFPESRLLTGEYVLCEDGKMRYPRPLRVHVYGKMLGWIRRHAPSLRVYLCMESQEVWRRVFNKVPRCGERPDLLFDE